jgi:hypothetical protein
MRRIYPLAGLIALAAGLAAPPAALADHSDANPPWSSLLPTLPVTTAVQPHAVAGCPEPTIACVDDLLARLDAQWRELDAACDHRVLFSRSYFRITQELRADLAREQPELFLYPEWMIPLIAEFSNSYFAAYEGWEAGSPIPGAWQVAFDAAAHDDISAGQDVLLGSNAHVQHDLPLALAEMGLRTPSGDSRKPDHDAINTVNTRLFDELEDEYAERYDPSFTLIDMKPLPLDELGSMELVKMWREGAWRSAERLLLARTPAEREQVEQQIELTSRLWAEAISAGEMPGYRAMRDEYCRA